MKCKTHPNKSINFIITDVNNYTIEITLQTSDVTNATDDIPDRKSVV